MGEEGFAGAGLSSKDDTEVLVGDDIVAGMKGRKLGDDGGKTRA